MIADFVILTGTCSSTPVLDGRRHQSRHANLKQRLSQQTFWQPSFRHIVGVPSFGSAIEAAAVQLRVVAAFSGLPLAAA